MVFLGFCMTTHDGFQPNHDGVGNGRAGSRGLSLLLALVVASTVFTALATFNAHDDFPIFDVALKITNVSTVFFEAVFILVAGLASVAELARRGPVALPSRLEMLVYGLLFGYVVLAVVLRGGAAPFVESGWWIIHLLFFFALRMVWASGLTIEFRLVWYAMALTALLHMGIFSLSVAARANPQAYDWTGRIPGFTNIRHLSYFMAPAATLLAAGLLIGPKKYVPVLFVALVIVILYPSWTGGRGAFLAFLAGTGALIVFKEARKPMRALVVGLAVLAALFLPLVLPQVGPWPAFLSRLGEIGAEDETVNQISSGRVQLWGYILEEIGKSPIFGYGPVRVRQLLSDTRFDYLNNPHNIVLQIVLHWGVVGLGLILAFVGLHVKRIYAAVAGATPDAILASAVLVTILAHAQIDGSMYYPFTFVIAILAFFNLWMLGAAAEEAGGR